MEALVKKIYSMVPEAETCPPWSSASSVRSIIQNRYKNQRDERKLTTQYAKWSKEQKREVQRDKENLSVGANEQASPGMLLYSNAGLKHAGTST